VDLGLSAGLEAPRPTYCGDLRVWAPQEKSKLYLNLHVSVVCPGRSETLDAEHKFKLSFLCMNEGGWRSTISGELVGGPPPVKIKFLAQSMICFALI
jgi:hypothetical protein